MKTAEFGKSFVHSKWSVSKYVEPNPQTTQDRSDREEFKVLRAQALKNYRERRENGIILDAPQRAFPNDGQYVWESTTNAKKYVIYNPGRADVEWMRERDKNYVLRLEQEGRLQKVLPGLSSTHPNLYAIVLQQRQEKMEIKQAEVDASAQAKQKTLIPERIQEAQALFLQGGKSVAKALALYQRILQIDPTSIDALQGAVTILLGQMTASASFDDAKTKLQNDIMPLIQQCREHTTAGQQKAYHQFLQSTIRGLLTANKVVTNYSARLLATLAVDSPLEGSGIGAEFKEAGHRLSDVALHLQRSMDNTQPPPSPRSQHYFLQTALSFLQESDEPHCNMQGKFQAVALTLAALPTSDKSRKKMARQRQLLTWFRAWEQKGDAPDSTTTHKPAPSAPPQSSTEDPPPYEADEEPNKPASTMRCCVVV